MPARRVQYAGCSLAARHVTRTGVSLSYRLHACYTHSDRCLQVDTGVLYPLAGHNNTLGIIVPIVAGPGQAVLFPRPWVLLVSRR